MKKDSSFWRTSYNTKITFNKFVHKSTCTHRHRWVKKKKTIPGSAVFGVKSKHYATFFSPKPNQSLHICVTVKRVFFRRKKTTHYHPPNPTELINLVLV